MARFRITAGGVKSLFVRNIGYKVVATVCSLIFFYSFQAERKGTRTISSNIIAITESASDDYILVSEFPPQVAMKLEGPTSVLKNLKGEDVGPIIIPIGNFRSRNFKFDESIIESLPRSVSVTKFYPDTIPLTFEKKSQKTVAVTPFLEGSPKPGRMLKGPAAVLPRKIKISGAESSVKKIDKWDTQPIYLDSLGPGIHEIRVNLAPPRIPHVALEEEEVTVRLEVAYKMMDRWFRNVPLSIEGGEHAKGLTIKPPRVSLLLTGPEEVLKTLSEDQLYLFVEITEEDIKAGGTFLKEVKHSSFPEATSVKRIIPSRVSLVMKAG